MLVRSQLPGELDRARVEVRFWRLVSRAGQDQRCSRLIDKNTVCFVHDRKMQASHDQIRRLAETGQFAYRDSGPAPLRPQGKSVAKIVEHDVLVGTIGYITGVGGTPR